MCTKYHWMSWIAYVLHSLRRGDLSRAANMLACCHYTRGELIQLRHDDPQEFALYAVWHRKMFGCPEVLTHARELYECMAEDFDVDIRGELRSEGWDI